MRRAGYLSLLVAGLCWGMDSAQAADSSPPAPPPASKSSTQPQINAPLVTPAHVVLRGKGARQQLVVMAAERGRSLDVTLRAQYRSRNAHVVAITSPGVLTAVSDGVTQVEILAPDKTHVVTVEVRDTAVPTITSFELDVVPVLTKLGCNAGPCHGKQRGQNGFQLSLLGFYPEFDYLALTQEARGRRVFAASPAESLLLQKATAQIPHGGGKRLEPGSAYYDVLASWIMQGLKRQAGTESPLKKISLFPAVRTLGFKESQQLLVTAHYEDGTTRDVTSLAGFNSNDAVLASVDGQGVYKTGSLPGEATIMARYMGHIATSQVLIPLAGDAPPAEFYARLPRHNFIDGLVWDKLQQLGITPSAPAPEHTWLRRVYIDLIGRFPTPDEVRTFLADKSSTKREQLVDTLLARPEYGDFWANKWADLLRPNPYRVGMKSVFNYDAWIRESFRKNKPWDQFVRELVTAQGSNFRDGPSNMYRDRRSPDELTTIVSQLFLGVRLECAKCHHHPFESYGQEDFYGFAAYFARLSRKGVGIGPPISGGEEVFFTGKTGKVNHPITQEELAPKPLFGTAPAIQEDQDPREALAAWITSPENPYFAKVIVNRLWADLMGRGLVEPVDDLRVTNPPTNAPLLAALAKDFHEHGCNLKHTLKTITLSYVYGLSSLPGDRNVSDTQNYSRHYRQRLRAETLLDALCDITQVPETFQAMPPGTRAVEIWTHRSASLFLDSFGRPDPNQDPPCERTLDTTVVQMLHLMNAENIHKKLSNPEGRVARLAASSKPPEEIVDELYLLVFSRFPTAQEKQVCLSVFTEKEVTRARAIEDVLWSLINTAEFVFKD